MHQGTLKGADIYFSEEKHNLTSTLFTRISNGYRQGKTLCFEKVTGSYYWWKRKQFLKRAQWQQYIHCNQ